MHPRESCRPLNTTPDLELSGVVDCIVLGNLECVVGIRTEGLVGSPGVRVALSIGCEDFDVFQITGWSFLQSDSDRLDGISG